MKQIHKIIRTTIIIAVLGFISPSCSKSFLEIIPKGKLIAQKTSDYNLLMSNLDLINIGNTNAQVQMGDEVAAVDPYFTSATLKTQRAFRWDDVLYEPEEDAGEIMLPMQNIYVYNKVINEVLDATDGTTDQKLSIQAEALAGRAWAYFLLINYYGKPYNETTSATDLGYPIVTVADVTETKFTRASVKEVYDFIVKDLTTAIPNLPVQLTHRLRMSKSAGEGLLAKVYMFMGKYKEALPLLTASLADLTTAAMPVRLYDLNTELTTATAPTTVNNVENIFGKQFVNGWSSSSNEIVTTPQASALFDASDLRLKFFFATDRSGVKYPVAGLLRRQTSGQTQFGVLISEVYLLKAECECRLNDLAGAKADVETLRIKRMPAANATVSAAIAGQQLSLLKFIIDERIREFAILGYRWFDMRRLSVDPLFGNKSFTHILYSATGSPTNFTFRPERIVLQFSPKIMGQNPGLTNNP